eukprot:PhM_4_TR9310/c0_g1_i1/m.81424
MTEFKTLSGFVSAAQCPIHKYCDDMATLKSTDPAVVATECNAALQTLLDAQPRLERLEAKAAIKDPDLRIYSDAMVEKICALSVSYADAVEKLTGIVQQLQGTLTRVHEGHAEAVRQDFIDAEPTPRADLEDEERRVREELVRVGREQHDDAARREARRIHEEVLHSAEQREVMRRAAEKKIVDDFRASCASSSLLTSFVHAVEDVFRQLPMNSFTDIANTVESLHTVFTNVVRHPEQPETRQLRCSNPNYVRDFGFFEGEEKNGGTGHHHVSTREFPLLCLGYEIAYPTIADDDKKSAEAIDDELPEQMQRQRRCLCLHEPSAEDDPDRWLAWYDDVSQIFTLLQHYNKTIQSKGYELRHPRHGTVQIEEKDVVVEVRTSFLSDLRKMV